MKTQGPEIKITSSCANCQFLDRREEGKRNRYTPDWCEFKTINIQNLLKELKL